MIVRHNWIWLIVFKWTQRLIYDWRFVLEHFLTMICKFSLWSLHATISNFYYQVTSKLSVISNLTWGPLWQWSYGSWIYNYLCNRCLSPLILWVPISIKVRCTTLCYKVCQWLATGRWFSLGPQVSSTNKTDRHYITGILLKVALNTIK
jgi:hypothetical protein